MSRRGRHSCQRFPEPIISRIELASPSIVTPGCFNLTLAFVAHAAVEMGSGILWIQIDNPVVILDGEIIPPLAEVDPTTIHVCINILLITLDCPAVILDRQILLSGLLVVIATVVVGLGGTWIQSNSLGVILDG